MLSSQRHGATRRAVLVPLLLVASVVLAGCFSITSQTTSQVNVVGDLVVTTELCARLAAPVGDGTCESGLSQDTSGDNQFFIAHLVSDWVTAPATISATGTLGNLTFSSSPDFAAAIGARLPAGAGQRWIAYASPRQPKLTASTDYRMTTTSQLGVPSGSPSQLALATVTGWRIVRDGDAGAGVTALPIDRAVACDEVDPDQTNRPATSCGVSTLPALSRMAPRRPRTPTPSSSAPSRSRRPPRRWP